MLDDMPPSDSRSWRYDAFISYRASTSARAARQLQRALGALSKRHRPDYPLNIFLDTQSLVAGGLDDAIKAALDDSRALIVLLAPGTKDSPWVDMEIRYWLEHGGSLDRLFLVRHDPALDLSWSDGDRNFVDPHAIPSALSGLFPHEQKWLDLRSSMLGTDETTLVGLYAPLARARPEDLLLVEADFQQRRRRQTRLVVSSLSVLLVVAVVAAGMAVVNGQRAEREARQARAEADAAQALLAVDGSPATGIQFGVSAANLASSNGVRASLLSLAEATAGLDTAFAFPREEAGYPGDRAAFAHDGETLMVWGNGPGRTQAYLAAWNTTTGRQAFSLPASTGGISAVGAVNTRWIALCSARGPQLLNIADGAITQVADTFSEAGNCTIRTFDGGLLISTTGPSEETQNSYFIGHGGEVTPLPGMPHTAVRQFDSVAIAAGRNGIAVVRPTGVEVVYRQPTEGIEMFDYPGDFAVRVDRQRWVLGRAEGDQYSLSEVVATPTAVDSAPEWDSGLTGRLGEVDANGTVSIAGVDGSVPAGAGGRLDKFNFATRIVSLNGAFVTIYRDNAWIMWPPGAVAHADQVEDLPRETWRTSPTGWSEAASFTGREPVLAVCRNHEGVILVSGDSSSSAASLVTAAHPATRVDNFVGVTDECQVVDTDNGLRLDGDPLRENQSYSAIAWTALGDKVAVVQPDIPIEVFAPGVEQVPWRKRDLPWFEMIASGHRVIVDDGLIAPAEDHALRRGEEASIYLLEGGPLAVHPSGTEMLASDLGPQERAVFVTFDGEVQVAARWCSGRSAVRYAPRSGFDSAVEAAANPVPIATDGDDLVDCWTGDRNPPVDSRNILDYQMDPSGESGQILWSDDDDRLHVSDWSPGLSDNVVRTRALPEQISRPWDEVYVDGDTAAGIAGGGSVLYQFSWVDDSWRMDRSFPVLIDDVGGVALADGGGLAVIVSADNRFELMDMASGHRVMSNRKPLGTERTSRVSAYVADDYLVVLLYPEGFSAARDAIEIPVSTASIREQLCTVFTAAGC